MAIHFTRKKPKDAAADLPNFMLQRTYDTVVNLLCQTHITVDKENICPRLQQILPTSLHSDQEDLKWVMQNSGHYIWLLNYVVSIEDNLFTANKCLSESFPLGALAKLPVNGLPSGKFASPAVVFPKFYQDLGRDLNYFNGDVCKANQDVLAWYCTLFKGYGGRVEWVHGTPDWLD